MSPDAAIKTRLESTAPTAGTNGAAGPVLRAGPAGGTRTPRAARQARIGMAFSQVVAVMMHDATFKALPLADLEWLVLPPLLAGQFKLGHAQARAAGTDDNGGVTVPVSVALWARVSAAIDKGLSEQLDQQVRLRPTDWATGDHIWLMAVAGDRRALPSLLKQLHDEDFAGREVKLRARNSDGKIIIRTLSELIQDGGSAIT